ncbi:periplasmic substrate-binding domain-containing protein [Flindersiella endophytica]
MNTTPDSSAREISRRRVLEIFGLGAAGTVVLAACGSPGGTGKPGGNDKGGAKEFHGAWPYEIPPKGHFNVMSGVLDSILGGTAFQDLFLIPGGMWLWEEKKWYNLLADNFAFDEAAKTFTYTIKKGLKWSDGKEITSKDVETTFWCRWVMRQIEWNYVDDIEVKDGQTVVFKLSNPATVLERYIIRQGIYSDATYGEFAKRAKALKKSGKDMDSDEGTKLNEDLQKARPDGIIASGPFNIDTKSITSGRLDLVKNKTGYAAGEVKFDKVVIFKGETNDIAPLVKNKSVDYATHGFAIAQERGFESVGIRIIRPPVYSGPALFFSLDKVPEFKDVRARQALAYVIDRNANGKVSLGESGKGVVNMTGFSDLQVEDWMSAGDIAKLNKYPVDTAKATDLLTQAGWKQSGGKWTKPDGKPAKYTLGFPSDYADWAPAGKNVAEQLTKFGIEISQRGVVSTQLDPDVYKGNFELAIHPWGAGNPHPFFAFSADFFTYNYIIAKNQGGKGINFPLQTSTQAFGDVDIEKLVVSSGEGLDEAAQKAKISQLGVIFNETLPILPLFERYGNNACVEGVRVKSWPKDGDPILMNSPYADNFTILLMLQGKLEAV